MTMSEEKDLREQFGKLGIYLINKAQGEIRDLNQLILFQKAKIKKNYIERISERSMKLRNQFIENYNRFLNRILSDTLINVKNETLELKNKMIRDLKESTIEEFKERIENNYQKYANYITKTIKDNINVIDKPPHVQIFFNPRDYDHFEAHRELINSLFTNKVELNKDKNFIGGFKVIQSESNMVYDYTLDNLIKKNQTLLQVEFSKVISETKLSNLEKEFEDYIHNQKKAITEYLKQYDQV